MHPITYRITALDNGVCVYAKAVHHDTWVHYYNRLKASVNVTQYERVDDEGYMAHFFTFEGGRVMVLAVHG